ncbi:MAG: hypothetical protein CMF23_04625 [Ignavibacteriae bacterium]|nr:hypothetical protein [Ignavibacteriota bacterium]|tara:strand:- start:67 stop:420 length:354 start_codon:yes stop_codon:yes gene_type:complete
MEETKIRLERNGEKVQPGEDRRFEKGKSDDFNNATINFIKQLEQLKKQLNELETETNSDIVKHINVLSDNAMESIKELYKALIEIAKAADEESINLYTELNKNEKTGSNEIPNIFIL